MLTRARDRRIWVIGILAIFCLLTLSIVLDNQISERIRLLHHQESDLFHVRSHFTALQSVNRAINAPPNNIFLTTGIDDEYANLTIARKSADSMFLVLALEHTGGLDAKSDDHVVHDSYRAIGDLQPIRETMQRSIATAESTFVYFRLGDRETAGKWMATTDQYSASVASLLEQRNEDLATHNSAILEDIGRELTIQNQYQIIIASLAFLLIIAFSVFGYRINQALRRKIQESDEQLNELSERKKIITEQRAQYETTLSNISDAVIVTNDNNFITYCNEAAGTLLQVTGESLSGRQLTDIVELESVQSAPGSDQPGQFSLPGSRTVYLRRKEGSKVAVEYSLSLSSSSNQSSVIVLRDVSLRYEAVLQLKQSEQQLRLFLETLPIGAILFQGESVTVNRFVEGLTGFSRTDLNTVDEWFRKLFPSDPIAARQFYEDHRNNHLGEPVVISMTHADGSNRLVRFRGCRTDTAEVWLMTDVTEQHHQDQLMKQLLIAVEQTANMIMMTDAKGKITFVNRRFSEVTGYSEEDVIGQNMSIVKSGFTPPEIYHDLWKTILSGQTWKGRFQNRRKDGSTYWEQETVTPIFDKSNEISGFVAIKDDISSELERESQLQENDKFNAIGTLAAGVAHEFKNYLGGIVGNASFALDELSVATDDQLEQKEQLTLARDTLISIMDMSERANEVAMSLLTFSKTKSQDSEIVRLDDIVVRAARLIEKEMRQQNIELISTFEQTSEVSVVSGKIQQLLLNLLINAQHAVLAHGDGGMVSILLRQNGASVELSVSDSGKGIPQENLDRIFDPFFSTKGVWGKDQVVGTGLGLAVCRNIAEEHHGRLTVTSAIGKGTTFTLTLPAAVCEPVDESAPTEQINYSMTLLTSDPEVESHYALNTMLQGQRLEIIRNANELSNEQLKRIRLLIIDGKFPAKIELLRLTMRCEECNCPYVLINSGVRENVLVDALQKAQATYSTLPPLAELHKAADQSKLATV